MGSDVTVVSTPGEGSVFTLKVAVSLGEEGKTVVQAAWG